MVVLVWSKGYSLFRSFSAYLSMISSLVVISTCSEVFIILLMSSWFRVALLVPSGMALRLCNTVLGIMAFSKYWYRNLFSWSTHISKSSVGSLPRNMSSVSMVSTNHPQMLFISSSMIFDVFCSGVIFATLSSCLHLLLNIKIPSTSLHPSLIAWHHTLMSSMYLALSTTFTPAVSMTSTSLSSHQHITSLATQQVDLKPIGPP